MNLLVSSPVALVTGASSGIGKATARALLAQGCTVWAGARRLDRMRQLEQIGVKVFPLDLTDDRSITDAADTILKAHGHLDILINNAGYGSYGSLEDVPISEARRQFEVNVFGLARLIQLFTPSMRQKRSGKSWISPPLAVRSGSR